MSEVQDKPDQTPGDSDWRTERFRVLNDGFIRVVDFMGSDDAVVQAARISYGAGTKQVHEDRGLIRYLMRHRHTTPFEMCEIKLHVRTPMDCWRQWIRHRTANVNEYSTRYSEAIDAVQQTRPTEWRAQSQANRQGSGDFLSVSEGEQLTRREEEFQRLARDVYEERLVAGVAREQARKDLPIATYTEAYWKVDLHNLLHFLALRMDSHAQYEIRSYANIIGNRIVSKWCPLVWEAFVDYRLESVTISRLEREVLRFVAAGDSGEAIAVAESFGWLERDGKGLRRNRERAECEDKLVDLGLAAPW
ncbi:FAD-dependent thymidylate synthase [Lacipirellula sp.]|uniref:FAD-dependent thymidylate synthase n=1 Tax=Lacipirellula sp. TaxID=2691419 RepID=UPI003D0F512B